MGNNDLTWCWSFHCSCFQSIVKSTVSLPLVSILLNQVSKLLDAFGDALEFVHDAPPLIVLIAVIILSELLTQLISNLSMGNARINHSILDSCFYVSSSEYSLSRDQPNSKRRSMNNLYEFWSLISSRLLLLVFIQHISWYLAHCHSLNPFCYLSVSIKAI